MQKGYAYNPLLINVSTLFCTQINSRQSRIVYEILRLGVTNIHNEAEYKDYRLCVKKRLNIPYHKQRTDCARMEKAGCDMQLALAALPTKEERIEQLKEEYQVNYDHKLSPRLRNFLEAIINYFFLI